MSNVNRLINSDFSVPAYPGAPTSFTGFNSTPTTVLNGWQVAENGGGGTVPTLTVSRQLLPIAQVYNSPFGDNANAIELNFADVGSSLGVGSYVKLFQQLPPKTLQGKHVTFSFWANASVAGFTLAVQARRNYGTGGTPSPDVIFTQTAVPLTRIGLYRRYAVSFPVSIMNDGVHAADVPGTNNDASIYLELFFQALPGFFTASPFLNAIPQVGQVFIVEPQLEIQYDSSPTPYSDDINQQVINSIFTYLAALPQSLVVTPLGVGSTVLALGASGPAGTSVSHTALTPQQWTGAAFASSTDVLAGTWQSLQTLSSNTDVGLWQRTA